MGSAAYRAEATPTRPPGSTVRDVESVGPSVDRLPLIDVAPLLDPGAGDHDLAAVARAVDQACRTIGFFSIVGHGVPTGLQDRLEEASHAFFARPDAEKQEIAMSRAGPAWRGWFPVGGELTSGRPDRKEGIYFGSEHLPSHPRVLTGVPLHGRNQFPGDDPGLRRAVVEWLDALRPVADAVMGAVALGLGLPRRWFEEHLTGDPTVLFRIFHYPPDDAEDAGDSWGVGEHTDYGLLTLLAQDHLGGLQVRAVDGGWIDVPPTRGVLVCNLGDMLERLTGGRYRSTPHRVRNTSGQGRLSFPYFFDPSWDATVSTLPLTDTPPPDTVGAQRWDATDVTAWEGIYGDYLTRKVARVFPDLFADVAPAASISREP
jgi:isopenicillin N synthase-like dioxygenase